MKRLTFILIATISISLASVKLKGQSTTDKVENKTILSRFPQYPKGEVALYKYLRKQMRYPKELKHYRIHGEVNVQFTILKNGDIPKDSIRVINGLHPLLDQETIRLIAAMPNWIPALNQEGKPVNCQYIMPIRYK